MRTNASWNLSDVLYDGNCTSGMLLSGNICIEEGYNKASHSDEAAFVHLTLAITDVIHVDDRQMTITTNMAMNLIWTDTRVMGKLNLSSKTEIIPLKVVNSVIIKY